MSDFVPIISASPPPLDDNFGGFDHWDEDDDYGHFATAVPIEAICVGDQATGTLPSEPEKLDDVHCSKPEQKDIISRVESDEACSGSSGEHHSETECSSEGDIELHSSGVTSLTSSSSLEVTEEERTAKADQFEDIPSTKVDDGEMSNGWVTSTDVSKDSNTPEQPFDRDNDPQYFETHSDKPSSDNSSVHSIEKVGGDIANDTSDDTNELPPVTDTTIASDFTVAENSEVDVSSHSKLDTNKISDAFQELEDASSECIPESIAADVDDEQSANCSQENWPSEKRCSDDEFADFAEFAREDPSTVLQTDTSWDAFASTNTGGDEAPSDEWAAFQEPTAAVKYDTEEEDEDDDFGDFAGESAHVAAVKNITPSPINVSTALETCFPPQITTDEPSEDVPLNNLRNVLETQPPNPEQNQQSEGASLKIWDKLKDVHDTIALKYQWSDSTNQGQLIRAVGIDITNMLWKPGMPAFASGLGMLEPSRGGSTLVAPPGVQIVDTSTGGDSDSSQEIPPVEFDWTSSGLTNPLDDGHIQLDLDFFTNTNTNPVTGMRSEALQKEQEMLASLDADTMRPTDLPPLENVLKFVSSTATPPAPETLHPQVLAALARLPDLSFMTSKVLMFPIKGD